MAVEWCPSCRNNCPAGVAVCTACGWSFQADRDQSYNRAVVLLGRILTVVCAATIYFAIRTMGRRPVATDYRDMLLFLAVPALVMWGALKLLYPRSGRNLWMTALLPSFVIVTGVFVARAVRGTAGLEPVTEIATATPPTTQQAAAATAARAAARAAAEFDTLRPLARECFTFIAKQPGAILVEFDSAGASKMMTPAAMEDPKRLDAARARIQTLHARLNDYEARIRKSAADVPVKVQATKSPAAAKADFVVAVRECGGEFVRQTLAFVATQRRGLSKSDELLAFAQSRTGRYTLEAGRLRFADAADQKKHDALRRELADLAAQRDDLILRVNDQGQQALADLNALPKATAQAAVEP